MYLKEKHLAVGAQMLSRRLLLYEGLGTKTNIFALAQAGIARRSFSVGWLLHSKFSPVKSLPAFYY